MTKCKDKPNKEEVKVTKPKSPDKCQKGLSRCRTKVTPVQLMDKRNIRTMGLQKGSRTRQRLRLMQKGRRKERQVLKKEDHPTGICSGDSFKKWMKTLKLHQA